MSIGVLPYFKIKAVGVEKPRKIKISRFLDISLPPPGKLINLRFLFTNTFQPLLWVPSASPNSIEAVLAVKWLKIQKFSKKVGCALPTITTFLSYFQKCYLQATLGKHGQILNEGAQKDFELKSLKIRR